MTEKEAAQKWCPFAFNAIHAGHFNRIFGYNVVAVDSAAQNEKNVDGFAKGLCIGSKCAMWEWEETVRPNPATTEKKGYCGLKRS